MKSKKAEMTTQQIVILIVLIAGFAVLLFFLFRLNLSDESDKQLCYNSVMNRANKVIPTESIPLNCKRSYICITKDGNCDSEDMLDPIIKKVSTKKQVYEVLANELADCWWMFGEGRVNYVGKETIPNLYCSLCSQIAFDDSVKQDIFSQNSFSKKELYEYMCSTKMEPQAGPTYCEYMYNTNNLNLIFQGTNFGNINLDNQYYSLMGITSKVSEVKWGLIGAGVVVAGALTGGAGFAAIAIAAGAGGTAGALFLAPIAEGFSGQEFLKPSLIQVNSNQFEALNCKDITTLS